MRKKVTITAACVVMLFVMMSAAFATPSFFGYSGLITTPTAEALSMAEFNAGVFAIQGDVDATVLVANVGVLPGLEAGIAHINPDGGSARTLINGKYRFRSEGTLLPEIAIGYADLTDELDSTPYIVLSKSLMPVGRQFFNPRVHVGVGSGLLDGIFAGVSADISDKIMLMAEYDTEDVNFGASYSLGSDFKVHGATLNGLEDFGIGLSYNKSF